MLIPVPTNVMLDIETYGLAPGSVIKSIGAVKFGNGIVTDTFYRRISAQSCVDAGLTIDAATVEWWLAQSEEARREMTLPGEPVRNVLEGFSIWVNDSDAEIWGNGAAYDNVLVACAAAAVGRPVAWAHRKSLCYRTMKAKNLHIPFDYYKTGVHHNALDDATGQALHLMAIWKWQAFVLAAAAELKPAVTLAKQIFHHVQNGYDLRGSAEFDFIQAEIERITQLIS